MSLPIKLKGIRPMSVNAAFSVYKGKKIKSEEYRTYETKIFVELTRRKIKLNLPKKGPLSLYLEIGVSSRFDIDNACKPFLDILQKKFNFNDNRVTRVVLEKVTVKRGEEYIRFLLGPRKIEWDEEELASLPDDATPEQVRDCIK